MARCAVLLDEKCVVTEVRCLIPSIFSKRPSHLVMSGAEGRTTSRGFSSVVPHDNGHRPLSMEGRGGLTAWNSFFVLLNRSAGTGYRLEYKRPGVWECVAGSTSYPSLSFICLSDSSILPILKAN